jgi:hypothetical protein
LRGLSAAAPLPRRSRQSDPTMLGRVRPTAGRRRRWCGENDYRRSCYPVPAPGRTSAVFRAPRRASGPSNRQTETRRRNCGRPRTAGSHASLSDPVVVASVQTKSNSGLGGSRLFRRPSVFPESCRSYDDGRIVGGWELLDKDGWPKNV